MTFSIDTNRNIVQGPDKYDLLTAFGDAYSASPKLATFVVKDFRSKKDVRLEVCVQSLQHEDGSGKSFNIEGYLVRGKMGTDARDYSRPNRIFVYYQTDTKKGHFRVQNTGS